MKSIFKIIFDGNPKQLEISKNVLNIAIRIAGYINNNPGASDFFAITNIKEEAFAKLLGTLKASYEAMELEDSILLLSLDEEDYYILDRVFWYGRNFGDDIPELEALHDDMWEVEIP